MESLTSLTLTQVVRIVTDIIIISGALALAFVLRYAWAVSYEVGDLELPPDALMDKYTGSFLRTSVVLTLILIATFVFSGLYKHARGYRTRYKVVLVVEAVTFAFVLTGLLAFLAPKWFALPRSVLLTAGLVSVLMFVASRLFSSMWRYILRTEEKALSRIESTDGRKTVLVIGGAGYIGSALLPKLLHEGCRVRVLDLFLYGTDPIANVLDHPALETIRADFRQVDPLVKAMRGVTSVVHLGGIVGDPACAVDEELTIDVNLAATRLIADVAKGYGVRRFIFASTCSVYGASDQRLDENSELNPLSLYARSKLASENVLREFADGSFSPIIARFGTIYGLSGRTRFDLVINLLTAKAVFKKQITVFGGEQWRPFVHVDDAARAVELLLRMPMGGKAEVFNVGVSRENYTIAQIGEIIKRHVPDAELISCAVDGDRRDYHIDFSKIARMVGFKAQWTVEDGVHQVVDAIRAGRVTDYQDAQYSNVKFMCEFKDSGLAPPQTKWAHEMISAPIFAASTVQRTAPVSGA
ncbi:MAG: NAD-dependent epimerase/dehydratase family protein [Gammaproteobacteria bacterium]